MSLKLYSTEFMQRRPCPLKDGALDGTIVEGLFVIDTDGTGYDLVSGVADTFNVYQIWTGRKTASNNQRTDVAAIMQSVADVTEESGYAIFAGQVTGLFGQYIVQIGAECYDATAHGSQPAITLRNQALTVEDGQIVGADTADPVIAYVDALPDSDGFLTIRRV